jgi:sugar phosphate isomerase/epimerase
MHDALRLYPGKGILPLASILRALKAIGYMGGISVEIFRPQYWSRPPLQVAREARKTAVAAVRQAGLH